MYGGFNLTEQWHGKSFWDKIDAIAILALRVNIMMFLIVIVISVITTLFGVLIAGAVSN